MSRINKPWGYELIWAQTAHYVAKILSIRAGHQLSRQYHRQKDESFFVQKGEMCLEIGQGDELKRVEMKPGDSFHCPPCTIHRMRALTDVEVFEVSTPELDDVVRVEDDYGRVG